MNILQELNMLLAGLNIPIETGIFSGVPPDEYIVITPMSEQYALYADNAPHINVQEARLSLFSKGNYIKSKTALTELLLEGDFTITDRRYICYENDTGYHHYAIDVSKYYL